jgi:hypothetical protein
MSQSRRRALGLAAALFVSAAPRGPLRAEVIISEVMYHSEEAADAPFEFIELYNPDPDPIDLGGYVLCDGVFLEFPRLTFLDGFSFLVLVADAASFEAKYGTGTALLPWASGTLANDGEEIELCNAAGRRVARLEYDDGGEWPAAADGAGHSLEIMDPYIEVDDAESWTASNDPGGSPGLPSPCWDEVPGGGPPVGGGGPVGVFTGHGDVGFPCSPGGTSFDAGSGRYTTSGSGEDIWQNGDQFQFAYVRLDGDFDIRGRIVSRAWSTSQWGKGGLMCRQDLTTSSRYVFVHDNPDPDGARMAVRATHGGSDNTEPFVTTGHPNWYRLARQGNTIPGYHGADGSAWTTFGSAAWAGGSTVHLGLALTSHAGCGVATLVWDSVTISGNILPGEDPGPGPDPGPEPGVCAPRAPVVINEGYFRGGGERWIELYNRGGAAVDLSGYYLTDDRASLAKAELPAGTVIAARGYLTFTDTALGLDFTVAPGVTRFVALVEADGARVVDAARFRPRFDPGFEVFSEARVPDGDSELADNADPTRGTANALGSSTAVVINEVMYHPIDDDDGREYIELYNRTGSAVAVGGWRLSSGVDFAFAAGTTIPAAGYLVVARDPARVRSLYGLPASAVVGPDQTPEALEAFGRLRDSGERITLKDAFDRTADTVRVRDGGEWPDWPDGHGSSLELVDPNQDNRFAAAWDASDDSAKAVAQTYEYLGRHGGGESELSLLLTERGITLVDDVSVRQGAVTTTDTVLVGQGEVWRYFKGTQAPPAGWADRGFNDAGWLSGATGIGYGDGDDATVLSDMQNAYLTVFCRKTFNVADPAAVDELILEITIDDGFHAYLNGTRVASFHAAGTGHNDPATVQEEPQLVSSDITSWKDLLVAGANVLAVSVHNGALGSSDVSFIPRLVDRRRTVSGGTELLTNGSFNSTTSGWIIAGSHVRSGVTTQRPIAGAGSLKILASQRGDNKAGRIETANGTLATLPTTEDVLVSLRARWVVGAPVLLAHGYRHGMAKAHDLLIPEDLGTPGRRNSAAERLIAETGAWNLGPVVTDVEQDPIVPAGGEAVTVRCRVADPDGVGSARLHWSLDNPSAAPSVVSMTSVGGGVWQGVIPGQALGRNVVFHITATDGGGRVGRYPIDITKRSHPLLTNPPAASIHDHRYLIYRHDVADPATAFHSYRFAMTEFDEAELTNRPRLSNDLLDGSFIFGSHALYYESHTRFSGSPWARGGWSGSFRVEPPSDRPLHGRRGRFNLDDRHGPGTDARERIGHYLLRQHNRGGAVVPYSEPFTLARWQVNERAIGNREHVQPPNGEYNEFWFPDDEEGDFFEMDDHFIIDDAGANRVDSTDGRVLYPPAGWVGYTNGENKEAYRWFFNQRGSRAGLDDYAAFIHFARIMDPAATGNAAYDDELSGIWSVANVEQLLRLWAVRFNISDWDEWGASRGKNCYFFRPRIDGRFHLYPWDMELTYETGRLDEFLIPPSPADDFNPGGFSEVNRMFDRPKIKRMYYAILHEMVNGPDAWFTSSYLSAYMDKLTALGMASTSVGQPGGYIDQRRDRIRPRLAGAVFPQVELNITTNGGNAFSTDELAVDLSGTAPAEACLLLANGEEYPLTFSSMTSWTLEGVALRPGPNNVTIFGFDLRGGLVDSDSITVTSTAPPPDPPAITALQPGNAAGGAEIEVIGADFQAGLQVFFGATPAPSVAYDPGGPDPDTIFVEVPPGSGAVVVTVRNPDGQVSNGMTFTYLPPAPQFLRGDGNGDGLLDISDGFVVLAYLFRSLPVDCEDALDADNTESLNTTDAVYVLNYIFALGPALPPPFPQAGPDPAGTALGCER